MAEREDLWVFGYGSLVWRPGRELAAHVEQRVGFIEGYARRFWQSSTDHRGVPGSPGRVVGLFTPEQIRKHEPARAGMGQTPSSADSSGSGGGGDCVQHYICWGVAYRIAAKDKEEVLALLDYREKGGYERAEVPVWGHSTDGNGPEKIVASALVYLATPENAEFFGYEPPHSVASLIARSIGPSGHNAEYLLRLAHGLRSIGAPADPHIEELEVHVRRLAASQDQSEELDELRRIIRRADEEAGRNFA